MSENQVKKGGISVETKNIFPVIKKWLYSDKDIFPCASWYPTRATR